MGNGWGVGWLEGTGVCVYEYECDARYDFSEGASDMRIKGGIFSTVPHNQSRQASNFPAQPHASIYRKLPFSKTSRGS